MWTLRQSKNLSIIDTNFTVSAASSPNIFIMPFATDSLKTYINTTVHIYIIPSTSSIPVLLNPLSFLKTMTGVYVHTSALVVVSALPLFQCLCCKESPDTSMKWGFHCTTIIVLCVWHTIAMRIFLTCSSLLLFHQQFRMVLIRCGGLEMK